MFWRLSKSAKISALTDVQILRSKKPALDDCSPPPAISACKQLNQEGGNRRADTGHLLKTLGNTAIIL